jgi:hypothetical protein
VCEHLSYAIRHLNALGDWRACCLSKSRCTRLRTGINPQPWLASHVRKPASSTAYSSHFRQQMCFLARLSFDLATMLCCGLCHDAVLDVLMDMKFENMRSDVKHAHW